MLKELIKSIDIQCKTMYVCLCIVYVHYVIEYICLFRYNVAVNIFEHVFIRLKNFFRVFYFFVIEVNSSFFLFFFSYKKLFIFFKFDLQMFCLDLLVITIEYTK